MKVEQKILTVDSRTQSNVPNIHHYLDSGWYIKTALYIQDQHQIQYIIERDTDEDNL